MSFLASLGVCRLLHSFKLTGVAYIADELRAGFAVADVNNSVDLTRKSSVVGNRYDGYTAASVKLSEKIEDHVRRARVNSTCGLVGKQNAWVVAQSDCNCNSLCFAARKLCKLIVLSL